MKKDSYKNDYISIIFLYSCCQCKLVFIMFVDFMDKEIYYTYSDVVDAITYVNPAYEKTDYSVNHLYNCSSFIDDSSVCGYVPEALFDNQPKQFSVKQLCCSSFNGR